MAINPRDFLLNTDYEMDKIIYFKSGSLTLSGGYAQEDISHNLGFAPLIFGVCAYNSDFSDPRTIPFESITQDNTITFYADSYSNKIRVSYVNYSGSPGKMYYRLYGFEPSTSTAAIAPTNENANKFILNTDYNYCKLCKKGTIDGNSNTTVQHNLGYIPQVLVWRESGGIIQPVENNNWSDPLGGHPYGIEVTNNAVVFKYSGLGFNKIHYRIYYDEA